MKKEVIHSRIWLEEPEPDNPFAAARSFCSGFDVYGDLLGKISWAEYLYLLFRLEPPSKQHAKLLESVAVAIANPGIRDHSVRAAMNAGVGGSTSASALIAALAIGAGQLGGAREVYLNMQSWLACGTSLSAWKERLMCFEDYQRADVWPLIEHPPGYDPNGVSCPTTVLQTLEHLENISPGLALGWLSVYRCDLENFTGIPLAMSGVISAAFIDLEFEPDQGELLYLLLRLPGAAVHALEQKEHGWRKYPFFADGIDLTNDPGPVNK